MDFLIVMTLGKVVSHPSRWYSLFFLQAVVFAAVGFFTLYRHWAAAREKTEKKQALLIFAGAFFPLLIGVITDEALPIIFGTRMTPPTAVFDIAAMMFFIYLAMHNYSLFSISPALAAETIVETMPDSLVVTNLEGRVLFLNEEAQKVFHKEKITGRNIGDLFKQKDKYEKLYTEVVDKKLEIKGFEAELMDPLGERLPALINARLLRQRGLGGLLGIVFVIQDVQR